MPRREKKSAKEIAEIKRYNRYHIDRYKRETIKNFKRREMESKLVMDNALKDAVKYIESKNPHNREEAIKRAKEVANYYRLHLKD